MSYTNHTTHYELPQWVRDDKPTFLSDMNGAFDKIDRALHENAGAIEDEGLEVDRVEAKVDGYGDRLDTVEVKVGALETAQTGLDGRITHNSNDINTINSLIGNGEPTTQDKTIIGAINELADEITGDPRVDALVEEVGNTPLDTTANTLTGAVNEVNTKAVNAQNTANTANSKADANANKIGADTLDTQAQTLIGAINEVNAKPSGGDTVVVTPTLQSGTKVADISVNGVNKSIYAPTGGGGGGLSTVFDETYSSATDIGMISRAILDVIGALTEERVSQAVLLIKGASATSYEVYKVTGFSLNSTTPAMGQISFDRVAVRSAGIYGIHFLVMSAQGSNIWKYSYLNGAGDTVQESHGTYTDNGQTAEYTFTGSIKVLC